MKLKNKIAVITGASSGIGKAIAQSLSQHECIVVLTSSSSKELKKLSETLPYKSSIVTMDVSRTESVSKAFEEIYGIFDHIDILINSAGIMPLSYMKNRHLDEWLDTIDVNVKGVLRCIYEVLPSMKKQAKGHIINIASVDGKELYEGRAVYGASKAALIALSRALRMELSQESNIRITAIELGVVTTDLRDDITDDALLKNKEYGGDAPKLKPYNIADAVLYAVQQPDSVNVNELSLKPIGRS